MGRFSELGQNKNLIMLKLIENQDILKCLVNNQPNFLDYPLPSNFDPYSLIYTQIFPYRYVPDIQTEPKTFITMRFNYSPNGVTFKNGSIYFYIITHQSLIRTDYGMLRYDFLINKIDEVFNLSRDIGIGKLPFYDMSDFLVDNEGKWLGAYIAYKSTEFQ